MGTSRRSGAQAGPSKYFLTKATKLQDFASATARVPVCWGMKKHAHRGLAGVSLVCLVLWGPPVGAQESLEWGGRVEGSLSLLEGGWTSPGAEARWWWRSEDPGAGWVRLGGFQVGPLVGASASEGERAWRPGTQVSSGYWGLDWDLGPAEFWGVQAPQSFEAGGLGRASLGPWSVAASAERTWAFEGGDPWVDRLRAGLGWVGDRGAAGWEGAAGLSAYGERLWSTRGRASWSVGAWTWGLRLRAADDPRVEDSWKVTARVGYQGWGASWERRDRDSFGTTTLGWGHRGHEWEVSAGEQLGFSGRTEVSLDVADLGLRASIFGPELRGEGELWAALRGAWRLGWQLRSGGPPSQTISARWRQPHFELEASWKVEGAALGWVGPQNRFVLSWRWES